MRPFLKRCFPLLFLSVFLNPFKAWSQATTLSDSAMVSLMTVSPGEEIYAHYGHTALRVADPSKGIDLVFNYGLFDFNSPNFIYRFVKGETDYLCGAFDYNDFLLEYQGENRAVTEQVINLTASEKEAIWEALVKNTLPENRMYRYNFFFNNCSTKPRDILLANMEGKVDYRTKGYFPTLRSVLHHYTAQHPWTQFGIDFVIGAQADEPASLSDQQFAPELLSRSMATAVIIDSTGKTRPMVLQTRQAVSIDASVLPQENWLPKPTTVMWFLFVLMLASSVYEFIKHKHFQVITAVLYGLLGLSGSLIAFLALCSVHPTTHVNYLLLWQNPLHLIFALGMVFETFRTKVERIYLSINWLLQLLALVGIFLFPQQLHPAMLPLLLMVLMRSTLGARQKN